MATETTIDAGNAYITDGKIKSTDNNVIETETFQKVVQVIPTTKMEYIYDNQVIVIPIPFSKQRRASETPYARAIDLKRIKETFTVTGFLGEELTRTDGVAESAIGKRNDLLSMAKNSGELILVWGKYYASNSQQTLIRPNAAASQYGVFILKMAFTETPGKIGDTSDISGASFADPERNIQAIITLVRGKDM